MGVANALLFDQAESALYDLGMELQGRGDTAFGTVVGDVRECSFHGKIAGCSDFSLK
jgi:FlaA1/EpsC-like NDP-sugar epimerase